MRLHKTLFLLMVLPFAGYTQIVNVESIRIENDSIRFSSKNDISSWYNDNNGEYIFSNMISTTTQLKSKNLKSTFLLSGNYNGIFSNTKNFQNTWLVHFRYNYDITNSTGLELFTQHNQNQILDITERTIFGAGLRFKLQNTSKSSLYIGNAFLLDFEQSKFLNNTYKNYRNSFYLSSVLKLNEGKIVITNTTYWQPNYFDFEDYNLFEQLKTAFKLTKNSSLFILFDYQLNNKTPLNDKQYYFKTQLGVSINI